MVLKPLTVFLLAATTPDILGQVPVCNCPHEAWMLEAGAEACQMDTRGPAWQDNLCETSNSVLHCRGASIRQQEGQKEACTVPACSMNELATRLKEAVGTDGELKYVNQRDDDMVTVTCDWSGKTDFQLECVAECTPGYQQDTANYLKTYTCVGDQFMGSDPNCAPQSCDRLMEDEERSFSKQCNAELFDDCIVGCERGFRGGAVEITCVIGGFQNNLPNCVDVQCPNVVGDGDGGFPNCQCVAPNYVPGQQEWDEEAQEWTPCECATGYTRVNENRECTRVACPPGATEGSPGTCVCSVAGYTGTSNWDEATRTWSLCSDCATGYIRRYEEVSMSEIYLQDAAPQETPQRRRLASLCTNTCRYPRDGDCDDGGPGYDYSMCELGSDCADCGTRYSVPSPTPRPTTPPPTPRPTTRSPTRAPSPRPTEPTMRPTPVLDPVLRLESTWAGLPMQVMHNGIARLANRVSSNYELVWLDSGMCNPVVCETTPFTDMDLDTGNEGSYYRTCAGEYKSRCPLSCKAAFNQPNGPLTLYCNADQEWVSETGGDVADRNRQLDALCVEKSCILGDMDYDSDQMSCIGCLGANGECADDAEIAPGDGCVFGTGDGFECGGHPTCSMGVWSMTNLTCPCEETSCTTEGEPVPALVTTPVSIQEDEQLQLGLDVYEGCYCKMYAYEEGQDYVRKDNMDALQCAQECLDTNGCTGYYALPQSSWCTLWLDGSCTPPNSQDETIASAFAALEAGFNTSIWSCAFSNGRRLQSSNDAIRHLTAYVAREPGAPVPERTQRNTLSGDGGGTTSGGPAGSDGNGGTEGGEPGQQMNVPVEESLAPRSTISLIVTALTISFALQL